MPFLPCILCGKKLDQRADKNGKPYFTCNPCGTQFLVRRKQGMEKLDELICELSKHGLPITRRTQSFFEIEAILSEIDGLKSEIEKLDGQIGFLFVDDDKVHARKSLKTLLQRLLGELEEMSKRTSQTQ